MTVLLTCEGLEISTLLLLARVNYTIPKEFQWVFCPIIIIKTIFLEFLQRRLLNLANSIRILILKHFVQTKENIFRVKYIFFEFKRKGDLVLSSFQGTCNTANIALWSKFKTNFLCLSWRTFVSLNYCLILLTALLVILLTMHTVFEVLRRWRYKFYAIYLVFLYIKSVLQTFFRFMKVSIIFKTFTDRFSYTISAFL